MGIVRRRARRRTLATAAVGVSAISSARRNRAERQAIENQGDVESTENMAPEATDPAEEVKKMADLRDQGIITEEEFEQKKKELLGL